MMLKVIKRMFSKMDSKASQNFFQIKPIYPDHGDKDFQIYNIQRKKIPVLEAHQQIIKRENQINQIINQKFIKRKTKSSSFHRSSLTIDKQTGFMNTGNPQLNQYIKYYKKNKGVGSNVKSDFDNLLMKLIQKFKVKSQLQLIKLLKVSIAHSQKQSIKDQIRGVVIQQAVIATGVLNNNQQTQGTVIQKTKEQIKKQKMQQQQIDQKAFQIALKQIQKKIQQLQKATLYTEEGLKKKMNTFDKDYGWKPTEQVILNKSYSLITNRGPFKIIRRNSTPKMSNHQDWSIKKRIAKLYFQQRDKYLADEMNKEEVLLKQLPIQTNYIQRLINELMYKYKEDELLIEPNLKQIYHDIDTQIDKIYIQIGVRKQSGEPEVQGRHIVDHKIFKTQDLIWQNLDVQEVFKPKQYEQQGLSFEELNQLSPHANAQLSLNRLPFNLYRHSEFETFGVFNKYKNFILKNLIHNQTVDPSNELKQYSLTQAKSKFKKQQKKLGELSIIKAQATRKSSRARVTLTKGEGKVKINNKSIQDYFPDTNYRVQSLKPLYFTQTGGKVNLNIIVVGGGSQAQSQCIGYAVAKVLIKLDPKNQQILFEHGFVGSDSRIKEIKRSGLYSERKRPHYVRI